VSSQPIRILHCVGGMNRGGAETWLMYVLRNIDREKYQVDFLVHTDAPCAYDDEILELGSRIISCPYTQSPLKYAQELQKILRKCGPYDVVHSHVHHFSGWILRQAYICGVPVRISHSHNDTRSDEQNISLTRRLYLNGMKFLINRYATHKIAVSKLAAVALFGEKWQQDTRCHLLYCGIDLSLYEPSADRSGLRQQLGLPSDAFVVGHAGRFVEQKNHVFLVEIMHEIVKKKPETRFLLIGEGHLRSDIEQKVAQLGLTDYVIFTGVRPDVPQLMLDVMDVFLMPSLWEGLPIVALEAQAAGLPCIFSDSITNELTAVPDIVYWLPLSNSPDDWANKVINIIPSDYDTRQQSRDKMRLSPFNIDVGIEKLKSIYE
jgi:glycosyltransferase involved in cell wall biosynthesis